MLGSEIIFFFQRAHFVSSLWSSGALGPFRGIFFEIIHCYCVLENKHSICTTKYVLTSFPQLETGSRPHRRGWSHFLFTVAVQSILCPSTVDFFSVLVVSHFAACVVFPTVLGSVLSSVQNGSKVCYIYSLKRFNISLRVAHTDNYAWLFDTFEDISVVIDLLTPVVAGGNAKNVLIKVPLFHLKMTHLSLWAATPSGRD